MGKAKEIGSGNLVKVNPITENQKKAFASYEGGKNLFLYGAAGTGKTFILLYNAMKEVLNTTTPYDTVYIVRSAVPTREIGFLPGDEEDKTALFQVPYQNMVKFLFEQPNG
jgi:predicted ribonuclease YlaK